MPQHVLDDFLKNINNTMEEIRHNRVPRLKPLE